MIDLNVPVAAPGTMGAINNAIEQFKRSGGDFVFRGSYEGVDPDDPSNTINLTNGYQENAHTSYPLFKYILKDVVTVEE